MKFILTIFILLFIADDNVCFGQSIIDVEHTTLSGRPKYRTLRNTVTRTRYTLDTSRTFVTAFNFADKQLWSTDPWKDNGLENYSAKKPVIARFFWDDYYYGDSIIYVNKLKGKKAKKIRGNKKVYSRTCLWVVYNNTQFGVLNEYTGKFTWLGKGYQD